MILTVPFDRATECAVCAFYCYLHQVSTHLCLPVRYLHTSPIHPPSFLSTPPPKQEKRTASIAVKFAAIQSILPINSRYGRCLRSKPLHTLPYGWCVCVIHISLGVWDCVLIFYNVLRRELLLRNRARAYPGYVNIIAYSSLHLELHDPTLFWCLLAISGLLQAPLMVAIGVVDE